MDRNVKYLIIGAGISGLTFANYADGDYLIIENYQQVDPALLPIIRLTCNVNLLSETCTQSNTLMFLFVKSA